MSGMWLGKGDANHGRERGRARARGSKRKLGVMSWGKGLKNIGLEGGRNEEEEEVKRREVAVLKKIKNKVEEEMEKEDKEELSVKKKSSGVLTASSVKITTRHSSMKILTPIKLRRRRTRTPNTGASSSLL